MHDNSGGIMPILFLFVCVCGLVESEEHDVCGG